VNPLTSQLLGALAAYGPWLLFALAVLETSFVTGLVVPSGVATSVATVLALDGVLELPEVVVAALTGGALGDSLGYWIGRKAGERLLHGSGRWARLVGARRGETRRFFGRHPAYSVTLARLVSFVRTVMPLTAGMSGIRYPRFLAYELVGLVGWVALYVAIGMLARESWQLATQLVGIGGTVIFVAAGIVLWVAFRRRGHRRSASGGEQPAS